MKPKLLTVTYISLLLSAILPSHTEAGWWWSSIAQVGAHLDTNMLPTEPIDFTLSPSFPKDSSVTAGIAAGNLQPQAPTVMPTLFLSPQPMCNQLQGLSPGQSRICELFWDHMPAIGVGAKIGIEECQWQFKHSRWNCTTPYSRVQRPILATRETAFTYAMIAAGVTHEVARACRAGLLAACGCSDAPRPDKLPATWHWGGCGDNIDYGYRFAKDFIDIREKELSLKVDTQDYGQALMNRWNNEVGRKILKRLSGKAHCKCHGVSGSCSVRTCWKQLADVRKISDQLVGKYRSARQVKVNSRGNLQVIRQVENELEDVDHSDEEEEEARRHRRKPNRRNRRKVVRAYDLVYLDESPDYCSESKTMGTVGTKGRECNKDSTGMDGCGQLCCGRGYDTFKETKTEKCNCRFEWCCQVVCDTCVSETSTHVCK